LIPSKKQIIKKAVELWHAQRCQQGDPAFDVEPEESELVEDGYVQSARSMLMRNQCRSQIEEWKGYNESQYSEDLEDFPIKSILRECGFVIGGRGSGKTNLLKLVVEESLKQKIRVKVFDPTLAWKTFFLERIRVERNSWIPNLWNRTYDISRFSVLEARDFVSKMVSKDLEEAIISTDQGFRPRCLYVLEEAQNLVPSNSLRSFKFQDISRFVTQGRNFGLSFLCASQRLASVDINLVEISGVKYFFKLEGHRNLVKARYWLDKFHTWKLRELEIGSC